MKTRSLSWLKKMAAGVTLTLLMAAPTAQVFAAVPPADVTFSYVDKASFNPTNGESIKIFWYLNTSTASVEIDIYDGDRDQGGNKVWDLAGPSAATGITNPVVWTGKIGSQPVPNGTYYYYVEAFNSQNQNNPDVWEGSFDVVGGNGGGGNDPVPQIGPSSSNDNSDFAFPNPFDPNTETTTINYTLNTEADVFIDIRNQNNQLVEQLFAHQNGGSRSQVWDGRNASNNPFPEAVYSYEIKAVNASGQDTEDGSVEIEYENGGGGNNDVPQIGPTSGNDSDNFDYALPNPFDPHVETTTIHYSINTEADVFIDIRDADTNQLVEQLFAHQTAGSRTQVWDGRDGLNNPFPEGDYDYEIKAVNSAGEDSEEGDVEIEYEGSTGNEPNVNITDVDPDPFDPEDEDVEIEFTVDQCVEVEAEIRDDNGNFVVELADDSQCRAAGTYTLDWDGRDDNNDLVSEDEYTIRIEGSNGNGTDIDTDTVEVDYDGGGSGTGPEIEELYADPEMFDPVDGEETEIFFRLSESADVTIDILDGNTVVRELIDDAHANSGLSKVEWDGEDDDNDILEDGNYAIRLEACDKNDSNDCDTEFATVEIDSDGGGSGSDMRISDDFADPDPFDPDEENTHIFFRLNKDADVTIKIYDEDDDLIRTLADDVFRDSGSNEATWNGEDRFGDEVNEGDYEYEIEACAANDSNDCDTERGTVEVDYDINRGDDLISDVHVNNSVFDPRRGEEAEICFDVEEDDVEITIEVLDGNRVIETLIDDREFDETNNECFDWDGEDDDNDLVDDDVYQFRVRAEKGNDTEVEYAYVEVDTDGHTIGGPEFCGGFWDVPENSPFCRAIELMNFRGIFTGYPDGSFRPYADINRAEAVKVVLLAHSYNIMSDDGSNLGYWDVIPRSWYMPFLRTAQREGVATGYPDRSFRPGGTINRVELLRVFLEASDINVPHCNTQPYADTPINAETRWYIDYACFAKAYGLMGTDASGNFNPAQPMSRGDVAMLFYNFETRGLYAGYNPNYYNSYYTNFNPYHYMSPGYSYYNYDYDYDYDNNNDDDLIDDVDVEDDQFDPDRGERGRVCFDILEDNVDITIEVYEDDGDFVLRLIDDVDYDKSNNRCFTWTGDDRDGDQVRDGDYEFRIEAQKGNDRQTEYADIEVNT